MKRFPDNEDGEYYGWALYDSAEECIGRGYAFSLKAAHIAARDYETPEERVDVLAIVEANLQG